MLELVAGTGVALAWLACVFTALQLADADERRGFVPLVLTLAAGAGIVLGRTGEFGVEWLRSASLRSDAYALGALPASVAVALATHATEDVRRSRWAPATAAIAALCCAAVGIAALAIGRSGWYWEFVAVIVGGVALAGVGLSAVLRRGASAEVRVVFGAAIAFGAFLAGGGVLLLVAWRSLA